MESSVKQLFGVFGLDAEAGMSNSTVLNATSQSQTSSLISLLLTFPALRDWLKLIVIGGVLEGCRRSFFSTWNCIMASFFITAQFQEDDDSYDWMMVWLSKQPAWKKSRQVEISTSNFGLNSPAICIPGEESDSFSITRSSRKLKYIPSVSATYSLWYKRRRLQITRSQRQTGYYGSQEDILEISIMTRDHTFLTDLLLEAKRDYMAAEAQNISIYVFDTGNNWRHVASRPKRPLRSIVLEPGIKDVLIEDAKDFLVSESWYAERGIPFRRGYLLYGAPGSGKTSMIHSLAGELGLDVYVLSLSRAGLDDTSLAALISELPSRCIALMEDIDAAFQIGLENRDLEDNTSNIPPPPSPLDGNGHGQGQSRSNGNNPMSSASHITLSGLLNAIDGIGAHDGRILYATTNKYSVLDPALCRPGRMDIHIEFKLASQYQAQELFRCFYLPGDDAGDVDDKVDAKRERNSTDASDSGYSSPRARISECDLINLMFADQKVEPPPTLTSVSVSASPLNATPSKITELLPPPTYVGHSHRTRGPKLTRSQVSDLAATFATSIPEREFSMAALQGYLMAYKTRPYEAVKGAAQWVEKERADRDENMKARGASSPAL